MKASLQEEYHSDNELDWIEILILDTANVMDIDNSLENIISYLKEIDIADDMIFLIVAAAKIYRQENENSI